MKIHNEADFLDFCEAHVNEVEADGLDWLLVLADQAAATAKRCGCPQCAHLATQANKAWYDEMERISNPDNF